MDFKIEKKPAMIFTGYVFEELGSNGLWYEQIPKIWTKVMERNLFDGLMENKDELGPVGISYDYQPSTGDFKYMVGVRGNTDKLENSEKLYLDEQEYVVFKVVGAMPTAMQETIRKNHSEWLPTSGYKHSGNAEIEIYSDGIPQNDDYISHLWVSIEK